MPRRTNGVVLRAAMAALLLGACETAPFDAASAPPAPAPRANRVLAQVHMEFDPATRTVRHTILPAGGPAADRPGAIAAAELVNQHLTASNTTCDACSNGVTGPHTISVTLTPKDVLLANLKVRDPVCVRNCTVTSTTTQPATLPEVSGPPDPFRVSVTVNVPKNESFRVTFDVEGEPVEVTLCLLGVSFLDDHAIHDEMPTTMRMIEDPVWSKPTCEGAVEKNEPVAYTRGGVPRLMAALEVKITPQLQQPLKAALWVDGGQYPLRFDVPETDLPGAGGPLSLTLDAAGPLNNVVHVIDKLQLKWGFRLEKLPNGPDVEFATSSHLVYVLFGTPKANLYLTPLDHTTRGADGQADEVQVVGAVWREFTDQTVKKRRLDPTTGNVTETETLGYYKTGEHCTATTTAILLLTRDGKCGAWARYLRDAFAIHGIASETVKVVPKYPDADLLVHSYTFEGNGTDCPAGWPVGTAVATYGVAGQGNLDPPSAFPDHGLVLYNKKFYDPSYGTGPFDNLLDWERKSIAGYKLQSSECYRIDDFDEPEMMIAQ